MTNTQFKERSKAAQMKDKEISKIFSLNYQLRYAHRIAVHSHDDLTIIHLKAGRENKAAQNSAF